MNGILSERRYEKWASFDVVYEWEDILSEQFHAPIVELKRNIITRLLNKFVIHSPFSFDFNHWNISIIMCPERNRRYVGRNIIPIYLDVNEKNCDFVIEATVNLPLYFVTSLEMWKRLRAAGSGNCYYIPMSISDKYKNDIKSDKSVDIIQVGRKNKLLHEWAMKYCERYKETNYIFSIEGKGLGYYSTLYGNIGEVNGREEYMKLLRKSKISLVSTPGHDGERHPGMVMDCFTPRFYESAISWCYLIGRYVHNEESEMLKIKSVCDFVESYDQFESYVKKYIASKEFLKREDYIRFINENVTSKRVEELKEIMSKKGYKI